MADKSLDISMLQFPSAEQFMEAFNTAMDDLWSCENIEQAKITASKVEQLYQANKHFLNSIKQATWEQYNTNWQYLYGEDSILNNHGIMLDPASAKTREQMAAHIGNQEFASSNHGIVLLDSQVADQSFQDITNRTYYAASTPKFLFAKLLEDAANQTAQSVGSTLESVLDQTFTEAFEVQIEAKDLRESLVEATMRGQNSMYHLSDRLKAFFKQINLPRINNAKEAEVFWEQVSDEVILNAPFTLHDLMSVTLVDSGNKTLELMRIATSKLSATPASDNYLVSSWQLRHALKEKYGMQNFEPNAGMQFLYMQSGTNTADIIEMTNLFHEFAQADSYTMSLLTDIDLDFGFDNLMTIKDRIQSLFPNDKIKNIQQKTGLYPLQRWVRKLSTDEAGANPTHLAHSLIGTITFESGRQITVGGYIHLPVPNVPNLADPIMDRMSDSNQVMIQESSKHKLADMLFVRMVQVYGSAAIN